MDDDFDLPDEGAESGVGPAGAGRSSSFVSDLFGSGSRRQLAGTSSAASNRSTFDDILTSAPRRRQQVTFQDEEGGKGGGGGQQTSSSLLDSLFPAGGTGGGEQQQRRTIRTAGAGMAATSGTGRGASPPRPQSKESGRGPQQQQQHVPPSTQPMVNRPAEPLIPSSAQQSPSAFLQAELDQLRREVSTMRYERSEDQRAIGELRRKLEMEQEEHGRLMERGREEKRAEMQELGRRHEREMEEARREADRSAQLLNSIQEQQGSFDSMASRLETLNFGIGQIRDLVQSVGAKGDELERGWREQQGEHWKRLDAERERWEKAVRAMEQEMDKLRGEYTKEIVEGRRWLEQQRELGREERRAFQEEQALVLDWIEKAATQLEAEKAEFLRREHDLLCRVLNERALLEEEKRQFRRQRDMDVARMREEAEHLEASLIQVESAKTALDRARAGFERRNAQLNQLRNELGRYEQLATQLVRKQAGRSQHPVYD